MSAAEQLPRNSRRRSHKSRIADIRATTVTVPLEAPLRHAAGAHWGRFVRTIVEIETEGGVVGLGEMGGGGQSAQLVVESLKPKLLGHDVFDSTALWFKILNPTAALYDNRTQIHAALEFACLDAAGKILEVPVYDLLGGKMRDSVTFASYLFYRYPDSASGSGEVRTVDQLVAQAAALKSRFGFRTHKLKAGVFGPDHELRGFLALSEAFPDDSLRIDPNASYSVRDAIRVGHAIKNLRNDYYEDPTWGMNGLRQVRQTVGLPIATNTVVTNLEQLAANVRDPAVDVVLLDTTFWGGIRPVLKAAAVCETFQLGDGRPLVRRARDPAGDDAPLRGRAAHDGLRRRCPLPPPDRRHHRRRAHALPRRRDRSPGRARAGRHPGSAAHEAVRGSVPGTGRLPIRPRPGTSGLVRPRSQRGVGGSRRRLDPVPRVRRRGGAAMTAAQSPGLVPPGIVGRLRAAGVIPVIEIEDAGRALALAQALDAGGLPIVEIVFRTDAAAEALRRIARDAPAILLIAGTVKSALLVDVARDAGASLVISPGLNRDSRGARRGDRNADDPGCRHAERGGSGDVRRRDDRQALPDRTAGRREVPQGDLALRTRK